MITWSWSHKKEIFTHQVQQSKASSGECLSIFQTEEAGRVLVSNITPFFVGVKDSNISNVNVCLLISARLLVPQMVKVKGKVHFVDAFCGAYFTFAVTKDGHVYGFGLSNYHQLGQYCMSAYSF